MVCHFGYVPLTLCWTVSTQRFAPPFALPSFMYQFRSSIRQIDDETLDEFVNQKRDQIIANLVNVYTIRACTPGLRSLRGEEQAALIVCILSARKKGAMHEGIKDIHPTPACLLLTSAMRRGAHDV